VEQQRRLEEPPDAEVVAAPGPVARTKAASSITEPFTWSAGGSKRSDSCVGGRIRLTNAISQAAGARAGLRSASRTVGTPTRT
jgi:hypothetical protein